VLLPATASAHPHVFIDNRVTFLFAENKIVGLRENWLFEDVFSDNAVIRRRDGKISSAERQARPDTRNLAFHYFHIWAAGKALPKSRRRISTPRQGQSFMVTLPKPVDPSTQDIAVEINDREYFVEVLLAKDAPIAFKELTGKDLTGLVCEPSVTKDEKNAYYGGFVYPQQIKLKCK
jgi:ABC-type uncharacterized transport system substrate-binding protein